LQSGVPSLSASVSATPHPQIPGSVFSLSFGQRSSSVTLDLAGAAVVSFVSL
jgi:hypothetical protein